MARTTSGRAVTRCCGSNLYKTDLEDILLPCLRNRDFEFDPNGRNMLSESNRKSSRLGPLTPLALVMIVALVMLPTPALAYIDPGTGSFVIQGIIAAVVGAGFAVKMYWHRIKSLFTGKPMSEDDDPDE